MAGLKENSTKLR